MSAYFSHHEPCPKCHSRDNLGRWSDGHAYCFGCGYYEQGERTLDALRKKDEEVIERDSGPLFWTTEIPSEPLKWLRKYGITDEEIEANSIVWLSGRQYLAFGFDKSRGTYYTSRYFGDNPKHPKYHHSDNKTLVFFDPPSGPTTGVVFVEDYISALKVGRTNSACPVFGSEVSLDTFKTAHRRFKKTGIWLDTNMYLKALRMAKRAVSCGYFCSGAVMGKYPDPKDHSDSEIKEVLSQFSF